MIKDLASDFFLWLVNLRKEMPLMVLDLREEPEREHEARDKWYVTCACYGVMTLTSITTNDVSIYSIIYSWVGY